MNSFEIELNGERRQVTGVTVAQLVEELQLGEKKFAVEINCSIVARTSFATTTLRPGDCVEIIHFVGGG